MKYGLKDTGAHDSSAQIETMGYLDSAMEDTDYSMQYDAHKKMVASHDATKVRRTKMQEDRQN